MTNLKIGMFVGTWGPDRSHKIFIIGRGEGVEKVITP